MIFNFRQLSFFSRIVLNAIIFMATAGLFPNMFTVANPLIAVAAAVILAILNMLVKPILVLIAMPVTFMTLGLFYFVINGAMLELTSWMIGPGFAFSGFGAAILVALIMSAVNLIITDYLGNRAN